MFLFALSNTLETYAMGRTHASIRALLERLPQLEVAIRTANGRAISESHSIGRAVAEAVRALEAVADGEPLFPEPEREPELDDRVADQEANDCQKERHALRPRKRR